MTVLSPADAGNLAGTEPDIPQMLCAIKVVLRVVTESSSVWYTIFCYFQKKIKKTKKKIFLKREKRSAAFPETDQQLCQSHLGLVAVPVKCN
jgi:hypothetical protein